MLNKQSYYCTRNGSCLVISDTKYHNCVGSTKLLYHLSHAYKLLRTPLIAVVARGPAYNIIQTIIAYTLLLKF